MVNVIYSLITIPTDGIVLIVIFFVTIQTGVEFHCDFLPSGGHCILMGSRQFVKNSAHNRYCDENHRQGVHGRTNEHPQLGSDVNC